MANNFLYNFSTVTTGNFDYWAFLKRMSARGLFPGMLIGTICNQQVDSNVLLVIGQITFWFNTLMAAVIFLSTFPKNRWALMVIVGLLFSKACRIITGENSMFLLLYHIFMGILFCGAGTGLAMQRSNLLYRQVVAFCAISIPLMILQLSGVGEWTQFLRTDFHGEQITQVPTLFVEKENVIITTLQARPAGFCWANNFLSVIIMFALGLHYGNIRSKKLTYNDVVICGIAILAMAKIVFMTLFVIIGWLMIFGSRLKKLRIFKVIILFSTLMATYAFYFPGVFAYNTSFDLLRTNFTIRFKDLSAAIENKALTEVTLRNIEGDLYTRKLGGGHESGYAAIARGLPIILLGVVILLPLFRNGFGKMREHLPELKDSTILLIFVLFIMPLGTSFLKGPVFWFIAGFALLPFFLLLQPFQFRMRLKTVSRD